MLGDKVAEFSDFLIEVAGFIPGLVGTGASIYSAGKSSSSSSGNGDFPLLFLGPVGKLARFLKNANNSKKLQNVLKKHLSKRQSFDCVKTATGLQKDLQKLGVPNNLVEVKAGTDFMFFKGEMFSKNTAVRIGDRVFDKLTGPSGLPIDEFRAMMNESSVSPRFTGLD
jgi:hypothetical protein